MEGKNDAGFNVDSNSFPASKHKRKPKERSMQTIPDRYVTITSPIIAPDIPSIDMMVLIQRTGNKQAVWVELSAKAIAYLHAATTWQSKSNWFHNVHPGRNGDGSGPIGFPGLSRVYTGKRKNQYRFTMGRRGRLKSTLYSTE